MTLELRKRKCQNAIWCFLTVFTVSACGGSSAIIAVISEVGIVTPLGGDWLYTEPGTLREDNLSFNAFTSSNEDVVFFEGKIPNLQAELTTATGLCGEIAGVSATITLEGSLEDGILELRTPGSSSNCLTGVFTDLITLEITPTGLAPRNHENDRVDVNMEKGWWVNDEDSNFKLKFNNAVDQFVENDTTLDVDVCDVSVAPTNVFTILMQGFDTDPAARTNPTIAAITLASGLQLTDIVFEDGATLTARNALGDLLTFRRTPDASPCPP